MLTSLLRRPLLPAILVLLLFPLGSCRENTDTSGPSNALPYHPAFRTGDRFRYSLYDISSSGYVLQSTRRRAFWTVTDVSARKYGRDGVVVIADSVAGISTDTLLLSIEPSGDIYLYGFLARVAALRGDIALRPSWDRVGAFTLGPFVQWRIGALDAPGESILTGEIRDGVEYVLGTVDGESAVFPAYRVDLTGGGVDGTLWFAENPPCVAVQVVSFWMDTTGRGRWIEEITRGPT